jgi:2-polyprenyl-3-methyl-5-hydroxy-6-metoxy-1,4-benzoquinol methylase
VRLAARGDNTVERLALGLNLAPRAMVDLMCGQGISRVLIAAARLGVLAQLAKGPATAEEVATRCELASEPTGLLLNTLTGWGYLRLRNGRYDFRRRTRKWLDPTAPMSIVNFLDSGGDFWDHWGHAEEVIRTARRLDIHDSTHGDPYWRRYITGQYEQARMQAPELVKRLKLPPGSRSLLDVAGGHGWFSAELCRRHPGLQATVLDLPASAEVGRGIIAAAGMSDQVTHVVGDALTSDLGGPHDAVLCFNLIHHLTEDKASALMKRLHDALRPGGMLVILDMIAQKEDMKNAGIALFFYLTSGGGTYRTTDLSRWLRDASFDEPRHIPARSMPFHALYTATRLPD